MSEDEPGRPRRHDELDPELVRLPRTGARIGPVLALSVIAACAIMGFRLRGDLRYARAGDTPVEIDVRATGLPSDAYVALTGRPDRVAALHIFASRARDGHRLMPVLGSGGALWILEPGDPWDAGAETRERYVGRVRRLGDLPFAADLAAAMAATAAVPIAIDARAVRTAIADRAPALTDPAGEVVPLTPTTELAIEETVAGRALVTVSATERHPDAPAWAAALARAGVLPSSTPPVSDRLDTWLFEAPAPDGLQPLAARLVAARLYNPRVEPVVVRRTAAWSTLATTTETLTIGADAVPWTSVSSITVATRRPAPSDEARVIVTDQRPDDYWYVLPIAIVIGVFVLLLAWGLARQARMLRTS